MMISSIFLLFVVSIQIYARYVLPSAQSEFDPNISGFPAKGGFLLSEIKGLVSLTLRAPSPLYLSISNLTGTPSKSTPSDTPHSQVLCHNSTPHTKVAASTKVIGTNFGTLKEGEADGGRDGESYRV